MTSSFKGKKILPILVFILFTLVIISSAFSFSAIAKANSPIVGANNNIKVAHISDIHYFPRDLCPNKYEGTHFDTENKQDFKLVAESGTMLNAVCDNILKQAQTEGLDILIVSGDNTKDGEKRAHIDLANRLRLLQNEVRKTNPYFQVLVIPGNHDLYNTDGNRYNVVIDAVTNEKKNYFVDCYGQLVTAPNPSGSADKCYYVTDAYGNKIPEGTGFKTEINNNEIKFGYEPIAATSLDEFMKIYSGLGYPDFTTKEVAKYQDLAQSPEVGFSASKENEFFFNTPFCHFVNSTNSPIFDFKYFNDKFNDTTLDVNGNHKELSILDYAADYTIDYIGLNKTDAKSFVAKENLINKNDDAKKLYNNLKNLGRASYIAIPHEKLPDNTNNNLYGYDFAMIDSIIREVSPDGYLGYEHKTGGKILDHTMNWVTDNLKTMEDRKDTIISSFHHGTVPHFAAHEIFMNDFILYDWEDQIVKLTDAGIKYSLTGHVHATDIASYVADNGKPIVDVVTGSIISFGSPVRYLSFNRDDLGKETVSDTVYTIDSFKNVPSKLVFNEGETNYPTIDKDPSEEIKKFFGADAKVNYTEDVQQYIYNTIMDTVIPNVMVGYVNNELLDNLLTSIPDTNIKAFANGLLTQLVDNFKPIFVDGTECDIFEYIYKTLYKVIDECKNDEVLANRFDINDLMRYSYTQYIVNGEVKNVSDSPLLSQIKTLTKDGTLAKMILGTANNNRGLLYPIAFADNSLLSQLLDFKFDFKAIGLNPSAEKVATELLKFVGVNLNEENAYMFSINDLLNKVASMLDPLSTNPGMLGDILSAINSGKTVPQVLKDFASNYLTDKLYANTSDIVFDILASFGIQQNKFGELPLVKIAKDSTGKYVTSFVGGVDALGNGYVNNGEFVTKDIVTLGNTAITENVINESEFVKRGFVPSMFTLTYGKNPQTEMNLMFNTASFVDATISINGVNKNNVKVEKFITPYGYPYFDLGFFNNNTTDSYKKQHDDIIANGWTKSTKLRTVYTVSVTGLEANKTYSYTINTTSTYNNVAPSTKTGTFKTAKADGNVTFLGVAGMQGSTLDNYTAVSENMQKAINKAGATNLDFILNLGNLVDNSKNIKQWSYLLNNVDFSKYPTMLVAGSKDKALNSYFEIANGGYKLLKAKVLPTDGSKEAKDLADKKNAKIDEENKFIKKDNDKVKKSAQTGAYYSYKISNVKVIVLNTNSLSNDGLDSLQLDWLKNELKEDAAWKVVAMHSGMYTNGPHSNDNTTKLLQKQLTSLFYDNGVDVVLQAIDKSLTTSKFIDRNGNIADNTSSKIKLDENTYDRANGVLYVTVGSIVDNYYNTTTKNYVDETRSLQNPTDPTFCLFNVNGNSFEINLLSTNTSVNLPKLTLKKVRELGTDNAIASLKINDKNADYSVTVDFADTEKRYTVSNKFTVNNLVITKPVDSTWKNYKFYHKEKPNGNYKYVEISPTSVLQNGNNDIKIVVTSETGASNEYIVKLYVENEAETIFGSLLNIGGEKYEDGYCFENLTTDDKIILDIITSDDVEILSEGFTTYTDINTGEVKDTNVYRYVFTYNGNTYTLDHHNHNLYEGTTWMKYIIYDADGDVLTQINYSAVTPKTDTKKIVLITVIVVVVVLVIINFILKKTIGKGMFSFLDKFKKNKFNGYVD